MRRFKLTTAAKVLILIVILALIGGGIFAGLKTGLVKFHEKQKQEVSSIEVDKVKDTEKSDGKVTVSDADENGNVMNTEKVNNSTINISLDEWIG